MRATGAIHISSRQKKKVPSPAYCFSRKKKKDPDPGLPHLPTFLRVQDPVFHEVLARRNGGGIILMPGVHLQAECLVSAVNGFQVSSK